MNFNVSTSLDQDSEQGIVFYAELRFRGTRTYRTALRVCSAYVTPSNSH